MWGKGRHNGSQGDDRTASRPANARLRKAICIADLRLIAVATTISQEFEATY